MKKIIVIGLIILLVGILSGCTDRGNLVSNSITGTVVDVKCYSDDTIDVLFGNDSYGIITADRYSDEGKTDWYFILDDLVGNKIKLTWIANYNQVVISYVEYVEVM